MAKITVNCKGQGSACEEDSCLAIFSQSVVGS